MYLSMHLILVALSYRLFNLLRHLYPPIGFHWPYIAFTPEAGNSMLKCWEENVRKCDISPHILCVLDCTGAGRGSFQVNFTSRLGSLRKYSKPNQTMRLTESNIFFLPRLLAYHCKIIFIDVLDKNGQLE